MTVVPVRTRRVRAGDIELHALLDEALPAIEPGTVVAITSKIVALCEGRVVPLDADKDGLIISESDSYLPRSSSRYNVSLTIKRGILIPSSGIDESNTGGVFVLWPEDPQRSAEDAWRYLAERTGSAKVGVVITDSTSSPLRTGVGGIPIAHAGFRAINDLIGADDLFGRPLAMTRVNVAAGLAAAAVAVMGEGAEQTPLAVLTDLPFVVYQERVPTAEELDALVIPPEDDLYEPLLRNAGWQPGGKT